MSFTASPRPSTSPSANARRTRASSADEAFMDPTLDAGMTSPTSHEHQRFNRHGSVLECAN